MRKVSLLIIVLLIAGTASALQSTRLSPTKATTGDFSGDGSFTYNTTGVFQVNNSPLSMGSWDSNLLGNLTHTPLTGYRSWTLPDATGSIPLLELQQTWTLGQTFLTGPTFTDYTNAQHDHQDADDGGTLSASAIGSGSFDRSRLPSEIAYEDEANTFLVRVVMSDGSTMNGYLYIPLQSSLVVNGSAQFQGQSFFDDVSRFNRTTTHAADTYVTSPNLFRANGTFSAATNGYVGGPFRANSTVTFDDFTTVGSVPFFAAGGVVSTDNSNLCWDDTNDRLGIGTCAPNRPLTISNVANADGIQMASVQSGGANGPTMYWRAWTGAAATDYAMGLGGDGILRYTPPATGVPVMLLGTGQLGFFNVGPICQKALTDSTGGTISTTCSAIAAGAIYAQADMVNVKNCLASILDILEDYGLTT